MGSAAGLGIFLTNAIRQTGSSASTLLADGVPALRHAAELEQALLLHQLVAGDGLTAAARCKQAVQDSPKPRGAPST